MKTPVNCGHGLHRRLGREDVQRAEFGNELSALKPAILSYARTLCGVREMAEDLAQEAMCKAWAAYARFLPGTNLRAWLFTILRNEYLSARRRAWRQQPLKDEVSLAAPDNQQWGAELSDIVRAMQLISSDEANALLLASAGGEHYAQIAAKQGCPIGTVKSRVSRARQQLGAALNRPASLKKTARPPVGRAADVLMKMMLVKTEHPKDAHPVAVFN